MTRLISNGMEKYSFQKKIPDKVRKNLASYPELAQELLFCRGIKTAKEAEKFLNPDYNQHLHDPFLIKNMERAVLRILIAIKQNEKIVIYSDYDCDGIPGGVILHDFFKKINYKNFENYIPHRHEEGYGLNISAIEKCSLGGTKLLITIDCGITDIVPVERANALGIDIIITDHHLPHRSESKAGLIGDTLPPAYTILNSKQEDDSYPFDMLCGTGVAFKLVQGLLQKGAFDIKEGWEKWLLDMVGLATIADMVPLVGENRVFAFYGLKVLRKSSRLGLQHLFRKMYVNQSIITEGDVGFMIAPRINAASRMGMPTDAFRLLVTNDEVEAGELADHLHKMNDKRKGIVAAMAKEAKKRIESLEKIQDVIVLGNPQWKPALLGLVANSIVEVYKRPVFLWGREGGDHIKGSCRSDGNVSIVDIMTHASDIFVDYGGHAFSGGFSVSHEKIYFLEEALQNAFKITPKKPVGSSIVIDKQLLLDDVSWQTHSVIQKFAPFGEGNPNPVFFFKGIVIYSVEHFGKEKNHLRLTFKNSDNRSISAIGFFKTTESFKKEITENECIDLVASMEKSTFRNIHELRLRIIDIT